MRTCGGAKQVDRPAAPGSRTSTNQEAGASKSTGSLSCTNLRILQVRVRCLCSVHRKMSSPGALPRVRDEASARAEQVAYNMHEEERRRRMGSGKPNWMLLSPLAFSVLPVIGIAFRKQPVFRNAFFSCACTSSIFVVRIYPAETLCETLSFLTEQLFVLTPAPAARTTENTAPRRAPLIGCCA